VDNLIPRRARRKQEQRENGEEDGGNGEETRGGEGGKRGMRAAPWAGARCGPDAREHGIGRCSWFGHSLLLRVLGHLSDV